MHREVPKAVVEVHFEDIGPDGNTIPGSTLILSRSVTRASVSTYKINGVEKNHVEVKKTLKQKQVDLDNNRFLILQGEVEQISLMKPLELLEYIEEVVDTRQYQEPLQEIEQRIQEQNEVKTRAYIEFNEASDRY